MRMYAIVLTVGLACGIATAADLADTGMVTRTFRVLPAVEEKIVSGTADGFTPLSGRILHDRETDWKAFFGDMGVDWPEGSNIRYVRSVGQMVVHNTPENIERLERIITIPDFVGMQVEIQVMRVSFDPKDIEQLLRKAAADKSALLRLWHDGEGKILDAPRIVTQSGLEAMVTYAGARTTNPPPILQVLPEVSPEGQMLSITLLSQDITTSVTLANGATIVLGGGVRTPDGKRLTYTFLTARLLDIEGNRAKVDDDLSNQLLHRTQ